MNKEIDQLLASEEVMWKQRCRKSFLKEGDRKFLPYTGFNQKKKKEEKPGQEWNGLWYDDIHGHGIEQGHKFYKTCMLS